MYKVTSWHYNVILKSSLWCLRTEMLSLNMLQNTLLKKHFIFSMLNVCRKKIKLLNKLTRPLRTGIFYIFINNKYTSNINIYIGEIIMHN